jgi:DNA-directed RNA polymerase specialized sigma24 family protein
MHTLEPAPISEAEKLLRSGQADRELLAKALLQEHFAPVYRLAHAMLDEPEAARQAVVQAFAAALQNTRRYHPDHGIESWLYPFVLAAIHRLQSAQKQPRPAAAEPKPFDKAVSQVVDSLGSRERLLLVLLYVLDWMPLQAARLLHVSQSAVHAQQEIFRQAFWRALAGSRTGTEAQKAALDERVVAFLKARCPALKPSQDELEALAAEILAQTGIEKPARWRLALPITLAIAGIAVLAVSGLVLAVFALRSAPAPTSPARPVSSRQGMPTPFTPPEPAEPLTRRSSSDDILSRMLESADLWQTLWIDVQFIDYGPTSYLGPPKSYRGQAWVSQPNQSVELFGLLSDQPASVHLVSEERSLYANPLLGQTVVALWDGRPETLLVTPSLRSMVYPASSSWATQNGSFKALKSEKVAGRETIVADWSTLQGQRQARLWVDASTGLILRLQTFGGPDGQAMLSEGVATEIQYDQSYPPSRLDGMVRLENADLAPGASPQFPEFDVLQPTPTLAFKPPRQPAVPSDPAPVAFDPAHSWLKFYPLGRQEAVNQQTGTADIPNQLFADDYSLGQVKFGLPWALRCARSPDGRRLAFNTGTDGTTRPDDSLRWFNLQEPGAVYQPLPSLRALHFAFAPDSRHLAVFATGEDPQVSGLYWLDIGNGEYRLVLPLQTARSLVFSPDGQHLALIGTQAGQEDEAALIVHLNTGLVIYSLPLEALEGGLPPDWPVTGWGVAFPVEMGGMDACAEPPPSP